ncbi:hypothetical protein Bbelb_243640 [Branchiostoma belcheri]|nr:hypothetical protein Bbelb_243640 [Branchiostoma belcheri]
MATTYKAQEKCLEPNKNKRPVNKSKTDIREEQESIPQQTLPLRQQAVVKFHKLEPSHLLLTTKLLSTSTDAARTVPRPVGGNVRKHRAHSLIWRRAKSGAPPEMERSRKSPPSLRPALTDGIVNGCSMETYKKQRPLKQSGSQASMYTLEPRSWPAEDLETAWHPGYIPADPVTHPEFTPCRLAKLIFLDKARFWLQQKFLEPDQICGLAWFVSLVALSRPLAAGQEQQAIRSDGERGKIPSGGGESILAGPKVESAQSRAVPQFNMGPLPLDTVAAVISVRFAAVAASGKRVKATDVPVSQTIVGVGLQQLVLGYSSWCRVTAAGAAVQTVSSFRLSRKRVVSTTTMFGKRSGLFSAIRERQVWGASDRHGVKGSTRGKLDSVINGDCVLLQLASAKVSASGSQEHKNSGAGTARQKLNLVYGVLHDSVSCIIIHKDYLSRPRLLPPYDLLGDQCLARSMYCVSVTTMGSFDSIVQRSAMASFQVTASYDETARMWDMESTNLMGVFKGHTCCVTSASFRTNDKYGYYRPVNSIRNAHTLRMPSTPRPNPDENTIVSAGSIDGPCDTIKLWDMRKNYTAYQCTPIPKHSFQCPGERVQERGFSSLVVDSAGTRLFASCTHSNSISTDSAIYMYNCHSMETQPVATFTGHTCCSFHVRCALSPCEEYLLSGSSDASAYIWKVNDPEACPWKLTGHGAEVTAVAWCQDDFTKLITCSNDDTMRVWRHQPLTDKERDPDDVVGDVQRVVRTPQKSAGTWKPETFDSGVRTVGVGSPRMATTVSNKVPTANAASPKHAAGASPNAEAVATAGLPTPENEQS